MLDEVCTLKLVPAGIHLSFERKDIVTIQLQRAF